MEDFGRYILDHDPQGRSEAKLCKAFQKALGCSSVGRTDDFLALGGNSALAEEIAASARLKGLTPEMILENRTVARIVNCLSEQELLLGGEIGKAPDRAPLTAPQLGVYLPSIQNPESNMYNAVAAMSVPCPEGYMTEALCEAVNEVLRFHPALYSRIDPESDPVCMVRMPYPEQGLCTVCTEEELQAYGAPFDLAKGPLCRVKAAFAGNKILMVLEFHHIVMDGSAYSVLMHQLRDRICLGERPEPETDAFWLADIEEKSHHGEHYEEAVRWFDRLLSGVECDSLIPYDHPGAKDLKLGREVLTFTGEETERIQAYLKEHSFTPSSFFMGAFGYALAKMSGLGESLFSTVYHGRDRISTEKTLSMMVRTLPIYATFDEEKPADALISAMHEQFGQAMRNSCVPFGDLVHKYGIQPDMMFSYQGDILQALPNRDALCPLSLDVYHRQGGYFLQAEYRSALYDRKTVCRFLRLLRSCALGFASGEKLKAIPLADEQELLEQNSLFTELPYDRSATLISLFKASAQKYPEHLAMTYRDRQITYAEADEVTDRIASFLYGKGIGHGDTVATLIPRGEWMMLLSLSILKVGAIIVPLDPSYPPERLSLMCEDASVKLLIAKEELLPLVPDYAGEKLPLSALSDLPAGGMLPPPPTPEDCYILLYTSGTTGKPKGCRLLHRNMVAFIQAYTHFQQLDENSHVTAYASYGFDAHMMELYSPLAVGASIYTIPEEMRLNFPVLKEYCEQNAITHLFMTTQVSRQFACEYPDVEHLRYITAGGEKLVSFRLPNSYRVVNMYGPTEGTIAVTGLIVEKEYDDIPIGASLPNVHYYVVDPYGRRLPMGAPGELVISGMQVAGGYLNRPEQTEKAFVPNLWEQLPDESYARCYKTGDIVRVNKDGLIEFVGRRDQQVKIRGFRIELSEVERVIRDYPGITDATVVAREEGGGKCIHAYIVSAEKVDISDLNRFIRERKPPYMVPAATMQIDKIPLTTNLKVDKRALPVIERKTEAADDKRSMTLLEQELFACVKEIVGHDGFGVETDFLEAGITSITSIRLSMQMNKRYGLRISSKDLLDGMTILKLENRIITELLLRKAVGEKPAEQPVRKQSRLRSYPLTQTQMGIYLDCMRAGTEAYNIPLLVRLPKGTDLNRLREAITAAVMAHPSMRCCIRVDEKGDIANYPQDDQPVEIIEESLDKLPPEQTVFSFSERPLYRIRILHCEGDCYLMLEVHHIIFDGESMQRFLADIDAAYQGAKLEEEDYTIYELALDEQGARQSSALEKAKSYYESVFRGISTDYRLCPDREEATRPAARMDEVAISPRKVEEFCRSYKVSPSAFFTGVFALTLARYTSHDDAAFATIYNGRDDARLTGLCSMLVKTLPLYLQAADDLSVGDFLRSVQEQLVQVRKNDLYSFADAARDYGVKADVMFIYQGKMMQDAAFLGEELHSIALSEQALKAEVSFEVYEQEGSYRLNVGYDAGKFSAELMESFTDAFATAAENLMKGQKLAEVDITSAKALERLEAFNATEMPIRERPVYRAFEEAADRAPNRIAVRDKNSQITYAQLDNMANALANSLLASGIAQNRIVEIIVDRTKEVYIGQLGILKAGCAFMCLSPDYPDERITFVGSDAKAAAVVTTHAVYERRTSLFSRLEIPVFFADDISAEVISLRPAPDTQMDALCYLIYTSGSTGKPKGVMVSQRNLINFIEPGEKNPQVKLYVQEPAICSAVTAFTFDASIFEGMIALCNACTVCIADEESIHNPKLFREMCLNFGVNGMIGTPSFLMNMLDYEPFGDVVRQLRFSLCGGESYPERLYKKLRELNPGMTIINAYGPSEATVSCSGKILTSPENITIGTPNGNFEILILDKAGHPLPMGALGELTILGKGVGLGYLNRPDLTEKAFIKLNGRLAYRTGDLSLIRHEGEIEYHGRLDNQVKLRGLRVELGEIESAINAVPEVNTSIVTVHGDEKNRFLAAYYTASCELSAETVRKAISLTLSEYMVPRVLIQLKEMPLTPNGKIDKRALPEPQVQQQQTAYQAPSTREERILCEIFQKTLNVKRIGVNDDFFELGGTSLTATKVAMLAMAEGLTIVYGDIFKYPTVRELCRLQQKSGSETQQEDFDGDYTAINEVLAQNTWQVGDDPGHRPIGNVLLTGATGFLGIHMLEQLLEKEEGKIYCLLRKGAFTSTENKLIGMYIYYFDRSIEDEIGKRIFCMDADITDEDLVEKLKEVPFDTLINCAACVKHFVNDDSLEKANVIGVRRLIELCKAAGKRLIHVSTVSVAGEGKDGSPAPETCIHENELYLHQLIENQYIDTKFRAERAMLTAISNGLDGKIMRAGNLMPRHSDGEFQINFMTNGFMRRLRGYYALGVIPYSALNMELEFSPIDETAAVILELSKTDPRYSLFHVNNTHRVYLYDVIRVMNRVGLKVEAVSEEVFVTKLKDALANAEQNDTVSGLIAYMNHDHERYMLGYDNRFTGNVLSRLGCMWSISDESYLKESIVALQNMGFFDLRI